MKTKETKAKQKARQGLLNALFWPAIAQTVPTALPVFQSEDRELINVRSK